MPDWVSLIIDLWPIASTITPIILLAGFFWLRTKFPLKEDFDKLAVIVKQLGDEQISCSARLKSVEDDQVSEPTRIQLLAQMQVMSNKVSRVEAQTEGVQSQLATANDYLQLIIERGMK
ncbi:hypothetical protein [uncultured Sphingobium sp.]|uniref:hypothetical protein n=1 Tax=uncultured Sphingobium sp. TaxID=316087 RepID=UPI00259B736C|nr:hypothetical protein [uncultured Sphingobium sp.]